MLLFFLILFPLSFQGLYIFKPHSEPSLYKALPTIYLQYNDTQTLNLQEYFRGFNLSFFFNDFRDPYLTFSNQAAYIFSDKKLFQSGFQRFLFISPEKSNEIHDFSNETVNAIILTENQQIYTVSLSETNGEMSFTVKDFMNLPNLLNCSNIILMNSSLFLVDCYNKSDNQGVFLTISLDTEQKIMNNNVETYNNPVFLKDDQQEIYVKCVKKFKYLKGLLFRFCPNARVSGVLEVFSEKNPGIFELLLKIDAKNTEFELFLKDFEIYQVNSKLDFELFILDEIVGPCTLIYRNNSLIVKTDFPLILGEQSFFLKLITCENEEKVLLIVTSHYLNEISIGISGKILKKRMNLGRIYPIIFNIDYNEEHYFVQLLQENSEFLLVFSRNSLNTNLLYKLLLNPNEEFVYFSLSQSKNLFLYNNFTQEYRFLSFFPSKIELSCCKTPVSFDSSGFYNKTIEFYAYNSAEGTQEKSAISAKLRISITKNLVAKEDFTGLRLFVISPKTSALEKEFFFQNCELPKDFNQNHSFSQCFQDYLTIATHENEHNFAINEEIPNFSLVNSMDFDNKNQIKLPLMKLNKLKAKFDENHEISYENPFVLGFFEEFEEKPIEISLDSQGKITRNYNENDSFLIETKLMSSEKTISITLFPDFSSISITFDPEFLMNLANNVTHLDLNKEKSLNLEGFFNGFVEEYSFTPQYSNNTLLLQKYIEKTNKNYTSFLKTSYKTLFHQDFAFIFSQTSIEMLGIPPLSPEFRLISVINLSEISPLFDFCSEIYPHETYKLLVAVCQSNSKPLLPKRLVFLSFDAFLGFEKILKQTPIPDYIRKIDDVFFIENALFLIEKIPNSLNESIIHVFSLNSSDMNPWISNRSRMFDVELGFNVSDVFFKNYRLLTAESFDVDYLIFEHLQMKILGEINGSFVIGIMLNDYKKLYYTEFLLDSDEFIGTIKKLKIFSLDSLLANFTHEIQMKNSFIWKDCDEFARFVVIIYNDYRLLEVRIPRFDWENYEIIREFQSFYDCFHAGKFQMNERFLIGVCKVVDPTKKTKEILFEFYVKNQKNFSNVRQTLSFKEEELANFELKDGFFVISLKNGSFLLYQLKEGISLVKSGEFKGNLIVNGSFIAKNRYSSANVFIQIKPEFFIEDEIDVLFIFLVLIPIIAVLFVFFALFIAISWSRKKRKEALYGKYFQRPENFEFYKEIGAENF